MKIVAAIAWFLAAGAVASNEPATPARMEMASTAVPTPIKGKVKERVSEKESCDQCITGCNDLAADLHKSVATDALDHCKDKVCGPIVRSTVSFPF